MPIYPLAGQLGYWLYAFLEGQCTEVGGNAGNVLAGGGG